MRVAIIDLGTNSVRFDVHQFGPGERRLYREKMMVRLGQNVFLKRKLDPEAVKRTVRALCRYSWIAKQLEVDRIVAFGTSALREARDREKFKQLIRRKCGISLKIISGQEEARLIALGVLSNETFKKEPFALVDIGGGSTELSICRGRKVIFSHSYRLGAARLQQVFLKRSPPDSKDVAALKEFISRQIRSVLAREFKNEKVSLIIGSSGTVRALSRICGETFGESDVGVSRLKWLNRKMSKMDRKEILRVRGMEPKRADLILAGSMVLEGFVNALDAKKVRPSEYSLRDGVLVQERQSSERAKPLSSSEKLKTILNRAKQWGRDEKYLRLLIARSDSLFEKLKSVHRLPADWRFYLGAAVVFLEVGKAFDFFAPAAPSDFILRNAATVLDEWEIDLVAKLCVECENSDPDVKSEKDPFAKLLAMLKVLEAMDTHPRLAVPFRRVRVSRSLIELYVSKPCLSGVENSRLELQNDYIEEVLGRPVCLR